MPWQKIRVRLAQPFQNAIAQVNGQCSQFLNFRVAGNTGCLVNAAAALGSEHLQWVNDGAVIADREPEGFDSVMMRAAAFGGFVSGRLERQSRALQSGVVSNGEAPITVDVWIGTGGQVSLNDGEQAGDLVPTALVRAQMSVLLPILKAQPYLR